MNKIIFISGWGTDSDVWNPVLRSFLPSSRCNCVSWRECLDSKISNNSLFKLLTKQNNPIILVGWSLGGMIALSAAITFPEKVSGLVIVSSSARMVQDKEYVGVNPRILKAMKFRLKTDKQGLLDDFAAMGLSPGKNDSIRNDFVDKALKIDNDKLLEGLAYLQNSDLRNQISKIKVPVNIIHGECDEIMNSANARYLDANLLNANLEIVGDRGHFLIHSNPELIVKYIKKLLNGKSVK